MSDRAIYWLTGLVVLCMIALLLFNSVPLIWSPPKEKYIKYNDVRGIAIEHEQKLYTLNFQQQNEVIGYVNKSLTTPQSSVKNVKSKLDFTKIIIYRFNAPDMILIPIEYNDNNLIFSNSELNPSGLMRDTSRGGLKNVLANAYDPS
ncbi:MAG: hypothetical protein BGO14_06180 [Chlamydiales bacterium 38-26]|mgnify:FL=1|nr:hypothetical protein [Chlamydiales bacterium]OJV08478.1 MAG: hypothetical protein BGO14_06180 [Chlamydiales bacterium 38-26]